MSGTGAIPPSINDTGGRGGESATATSRRTLCARNVATPVGSHRHRRYTISFRCQREEPMRKITSWLSAHPVTPGSRWVRTTKTEGDISCEPSTCRTTRGGGGYSISVAAASVQRCGSQSKKSRIQEGGIAPAPTPESVRSICASFGHILEVKLYGNRTRRRAYRCGPQEKAAG